MRMRAWSACARPLLLLAAGALSAGCPAKEQAPAPSGIVSAAPATSGAAATSAPSDRTYAGTIGDKLRIGMQLHRDGPILSGTYWYATGSGKLDLNGMVSADGSIDMTESSASVPTGRFRGRLGPEGKMSGTWSDARGERKLPFDAAPGEPPPVPREVPAAADREPVPPAGPSDWVTLYSTLARMNGVNVAAGEVANAVKNGSPPFEFQQKIKAPFTDMGSLYFADIDNDGTPEYVLCDKNSVGLHNSRVVAVYHPQKAVMIEVPIPAGLPGDPSYLASPFLSVDPEGVTMSFDEGSKRARYVWKGGKIRLLERAPSKAP